MMYDFERFIYLLDTDGAITGDSPSAIWDCMDECCMFDHDDDDHNVYDGYLIDTVKMTVKKATFGVIKNRVPNINIR